jgi:hypothetical protein
MEPSENNKVTTEKKPRKKALKITVGVVVFLLLLLVLAVGVVVPAYVSSESGRLFILAKANASGAGAVDFANLSMSWVKGINISKLSFKDKAQSVSVAVKGFSTKPHYGALLGGNLSLGETVIDEPRIEIDVEKMKQKPEDRGPGSAQGATPGKQKTGAGLPIGRIDLVVKDGDVKIKGGQGAVEVSQINSKVNLRPAGEQSSIDLNAAIKEGGSQSTITAKGKATPSSKTGWGLQGMAGNITIEVNELDLKSLESILAVAGVEISAKGVISANINGAIDDGKLQTIETQITGKGLEVGGAPLKGDTLKTGNLTAEVQLKGKGDLISVEKLDVATDWAKVQASGTVPMSVKSLEEFTAADSKYELKGDLECDIPAVVSQLPKTLGIKEKTKLTGGKLVGSVQTLSEGGQKKLAGQVSIDGLAGVVEGKPIAISEPIRAEVVIASEGKQVKFDKADVTSSFAKVNCTGTTEALSYDAQIDLAKLSSELGQFADLGKYNLGGQVSSKGVLSNNKNTTMVISSSNITNLRVSPTADITITEPNASVSITAAIDKATNVLLVKQLKADTSLGQFAVKDGRLPMSKDTKEAVSLTASARGVDLARVQPYLVTSKVISKDLLLGGVVESDVTVSFKDGSYRVTTESTKIANLLVKSPGKEPFMQNPVAIILDAEANPTTKSWAVNKAEITSPNIKVKGNIQQKVEGETSSIEGNAQLDYDWKTLSTMLSSFIPSELVIEGKRKDAISFASRYPTGKVDAMLANLNAQAKMGFDKAGYMGLNIGATSVDIKVDKGFLTIAPFTTVVNNGQFNFGGTADFKKKPALFRTPGPMHIVKDVQINDEIMNRMLARVNPVFAGAKETSGLANFDCSGLVIPIIGGVPENVDIAGTVSLTQVKMQPTGLLGAILAATGGSSGDVMTIHPTPFTVKDGYVRYTDMQMDIGSMPINFGGIVPLDPDKQIENLSIILPISGTGKVVKVGKETGTQRVTAYVKGTPRHPKLDLGKMLQEQAIQTGLELLLEKAGKGK